MENGAGNDWYFYCHQKSQLKCSQTFSIHGNKIIMYQTKCAEDKNMKVQFLLNTLQKQKVSFKLLQYYQKSFNEVSFQ